MGYEPAFDRSWKCFLNRENQGELSHRYVLGLYSILEYLTEMFPDVLLRVAPAEEEDLMQEALLYAADMDK